MVLLSQVLILSSRSRCRVNSSQTALIIIQTLAQVVEKMSDSFSFSGRIAFIIAAVILFIESIVECGEIPASELMGLDSFPQA